MKIKLVVLGTVPLVAMLLQGCIAFPPLIQVEHKDSPPDTEVVKRLDSIDHRLDEMERKMDARSAPN
jgi:hypothetical protein